MTRMFASLFATVAIAIASVGPANAEPIYQTYSVKVSYADLDLTRVEGVETMSRRINRAVDKVCGRPAEAKSQAARRVIQACRAQSLAQAIAAIDAPLLTARYQGAEGIHLASR